MSVGDIKCPETYACSSKSDATALRETSVAWEGDIYIQLL
jgi:hypothetical protein